MTLQLLLCLWWDAELQWSLWACSSSGYFVILSVLLEGLGQARGVLVWSPGMGYVQICCFLRMQIVTINLCKSLKFFDVPSNKHWQTISNLLNKRSQKNIVVV